MTHSVAHEGHHLQVGDIENSWLKPDPLSSNWDRFIDWIGGFHFVFLHFPIAMIVMSVAAELLGVWFRNPLFSDAARFMILTAAIFAPITALLGLALGYHSNYQGAELDLYTWHRLFGLLTAGLAVITAILREGYTYRIFRSLTGYYIALVALFILVSLTGSFGGEMTFGVKDEAVSNE